MFKQAIWAVSIFAVALGLFAACLVITPSHKECAAKNYHEDAQKPESQRQGAVAIFLLCEGEALDKNEGVITALGTLLIAAFTLTLWLVTGKAVALSREEFAATHRPQIKIHSVKYDPIVNKEGDVDFDKIGARVIFYNTGTGTATISVIRYSIRQRVGPLESGIFGTEVVPPNHARIESGMGDSIEMPSDLEIRAARIAGDSTSKVYLIGVIYYSDQRGGRRQTSFCRVWGGTPQRRIWCPADEPEYEYSY